MVLLFATSRAHAAPPTATEPAPPSGPASAPATNGAKSAAQPDLSLPEDAAAVSPTTPEPEPAADPFTRIAELEASLEQTRSLVQNHQPRVVVGGYIDLGFFVPQGDGSGIVRIDPTTLMSRFGIGGMYGWAFVGDLLSTAVNSRGEVADLGDPAGAPPRYDSIHSGGAPGFVANEINLTLTSGIGDSLLATASVNFTPRSGSDFNLGDSFDADIAQLEWMPTKSQRTSIFVGKVDSVLGIEYRERKSNQRFGITPSLIARYTTGTALGIKVRSKMGPDDLFVVAGAVTNGSFTTEQFHFYNEIDTNAGKTASGRVSLHPPIPVDMELGASGMYGPQDRSPNDAGKMWFWGIDYQLHLRNFDLKAQYLRGASPGDPSNPQNEVFALRLHGGGYLELDEMLLPWLGLMGRIEYRDADVWLGDPNDTGGADRIYVTRSWRATGGVRVVFNDRVILKAEYLHNGEYDGIPQIRNDVFTSSLVVIY
jgi:hypothetical protein